MTRVVNLGLSKKSDTEPDVVMEGGSLAAGDFSENLKQSNQELEEECVELQDVVDKMANILSKMEKMVHAERGICELEAFRFGEKGRAAPLFHTWSTHQFAVRTHSDGTHSEDQIDCRGSIGESDVMRNFSKSVLMKKQTHLHHGWPEVEVSSKLYESYKLELALKKTILRELAHTANADLSMVYLSSWLYQAYIEDSGKLLLEQGCPNSVLEGRCPAEFSSNLPQHT